MRAALGHVYTIARHISDRARPPEVPPGSPWNVDLEDPRLGTVSLTGVHHDRVGSQALLVLVHGLGGSIDSGYMRRMALVGHRAGYSILRLNLRGADRSGADIYHAGLTADLRAALADPSLAHYQARAVVGFSLGGHMSLRFAGESPEAIDAVVAVCSPLDLDAGARHIDSLSRRIYCRHLLRGLREIYAESASSIEGLVGLSVADSLRIKTIREWDDRVVAPRFGFAGASDYYASATALNVLDSISAPTLLVRAPDDPMISSRAAALARARDADVWRIHGGHIGFPENRSLEGRILRWLDSRVGISRRQPPI